MTIGRVSRGRRPDRPALPLLTASVLAILVALGAGAWGVALARSQARDEAVALANRLSSFVVGPAMAGEATGDPQSAVTLDRLARTRVPDDPVSAITVWSVRDVAVVYSTDPTQRGRRGPPETDLSAVATGTPVAQLDPSGRRPGAPSGVHGIQVYVPIPSSGGATVLEMHYADQQYHRRILQLAGPLVATAVVPILLLQLAQLPIVLATTRRILGRQRHQNRMLRHALSSAERQRREIAAGLHDTVVQNLAGAGYVLSAIEPDIPSERRSGAHAARTTLQESVESLRGLLVDLDPDTLTATGLPGALDALLAAVARTGTVVSTDVYHPQAVPPGLSDTVAATLYRIVREWITVRSDHITTLAVEITPSRPDAAHPDVDVATDRTVTLRLTDDGTVPGAARVADGPDPDGPDDRADDDVATDESGQLALLMLRSWVGDLDGAVRTVRCDRGTELTVTVPIR